MLEASPISIQMNEGYLPLTGIGAFNEKFKAV